MLILIGLAILPSIFFLFVIQDSYYQFVLKSSVNEKQIVLEEMNKAITLKFDSYHNLSMSIYHNTLTRNYIDQHAGASEEHVRLFLASLVNSEKYLVSAILEENEKSISVGYNYFNISEYTDKYRDRVLQERGGIVWLPTENMSSSNSKLHHFALARAINSPQETIGILWLFFSEDLINDVYLNQDFLKSSNEFYIMDSRSHVISSNKVQTIAKEFTDAYFLRATEHNGPANFVTNPETQKSMILISSKMSVEDWTIYFLGDKEKTLLPATQIRILSSIIIILYILFAFFAYALLSKHVFARLKTLSENMGGATAGKLQKIALTDSQQAVKHSEIDLLISNYNYMVDRIDGLIVKVRAEEQAKNDEKLRALAMQIRPHFVYNTLNTIKWMAIANKQTNIKLMIESMIKLMAGATFDQEEYVTLSKEIELLEAYTYIQRMRFMNFSFTYTLPEEIQDYKIMKFILQPIVENSILHGFRSKRSGGMIHISFRASQVLEIEISDNGEGFDVTQKKCTQDSTRSDHLGLVNVRERIDLHYGKQYGMAIQSQVHKGTTVKLSLPIIQDEGRRIPGITG